MSFGPFVVTDAVRTRGPVRCTFNLSDLDEGAVMMRCGPRWTLWALAAIVFAFPGCGRQSAKHRLTGKWRGTIEFKEEALRQKRAEAEKNPLAKALLETIIKGFESGSMDIELKADDSFAMTARLGPLTNASHGTWQVLNAAGQAVVLQLIDHTGKVQQGGLRFVDANTVLMDIVGKEGEYLAVFRCTRVP